MFSCQVGVHLDQFPHLLHHANDQLLGEGQEQGDKAELSACHLEPS